eukprot:4791965-Pyramimonas_sp.AAC.1
MEPAVLAKPGWLEAAQAVMAAPAEATCRPAGKIIEFFVVSRFFRGAKASVAHWLDLGPRHPVALDVLGP